MTLQCESRVVAHNDKPDSPNPIHSDAGARELGYPAALVPGITTYSYVVEVLRSALGPDWDAHARVQIRFTSPVFDGDILSIRVAGATYATTSTLVSFLVSRYGATCATGTVTVLKSEAQAPPEDRFPRIPLPRNPREFSEEAVLESELLGAVPVEVSSDAVTAYYGALGVPARQTAPSAWLANAYWDLVTLNFQRKGAGIHASTDLWHYRQVQVGERLEARGRFESLFGRRGNRYYVVKLGLVDESGSVVLVSYHTAIYHLRRASDDA